MNIAFFYVLNSNAESKKKKIGIASSILVIPCIISLLMFFNYKEKGKPVDVTVVQPNFEPHYQKFNIPEDIQADKIVRISASKIDHNTQLIIYPETVFDPVNLDDPYQTTVNTKLHSYLA